MTIAFKTHDRQVITGTVGPGSSSTTFSFTVRNDCTSVYVARILLSHFAGGHQNAGGSYMTSIAVEGQNGSYSVIPYLTGISGQLGTNPSYDYQEFPPTGDTNITDGGSNPYTFVWGLSGSAPGNILVMTATNQSGSTAGFDFSAFIDIYTTASQ